MGSGPGSPFDLEDKAPWISWMSNFWGVTDSPHPHKQEVWTQYRLLLSFLGGYFSSLQTKLRQRKICKKILKSGKILRNRRPGIPFKKTAYASSVFLASTSVQLATYMLWFRSSRRVLDWRDLWLQVHIQQSPDKTKGFEQCTTTNQHMYTLTIKSGKANALEVEL